MTLWDEIRERRRYGVVHCGSVEGTHEKDAAARLFGLDPNGLSQSIAPETARRVLRLVLTEDLAYGAPIMPREAADRLVERFAHESRMDAPGVRIFGNLDPEFSTPERVFGAWTSATAATFDTGALIVAADHCACLWVEDED